VSDSIFLLWLGGYVLVIWGIVDAVSQPDVAWRELRKDRTIWVLIQVFLGIVGTALYFVMVRPQLRRAAEHHGAS